MNTISNFWPARPTCHDNERAAHLFGPTAWRAPLGDRGGPYDENYRRCSFCGSIHPEDLASALEAGARMSLADKKYGYLHKFYVEMPNPKSGKECVVGSRSGPGLPKGGEPIVGVASATMTAKFYTQHLHDLAPDAFDTLAKLILTASGIAFSRDEHGIRYQSIPRAADGATN